MLNLVFSKDTTINVACKATLQNVADLTENFRIIKPIFRNQWELDKLYWLIGRCELTLNEILFLATSNGITVIISDDHSVLATYEGANLLITEDYQFLKTEDGQSIITE